MLHIFLLKSDNRFRTVSFTQKLVLGETVPYWAERAVNEYIERYCDLTPPASPWDEPDNEPCTFGVINEDYQFDEATEAARALFNSNAIAEDGDVLFVWDDVLAITWEFIRDLVDSHRDNDNVSTWAYEQPDGNYNTSGTPLALVVKGRNFKQGLYNSEIQNKPYYRVDVWRFFYPVTTYEFKEKFKHVEYSLYFPGQVKLVRERVVEHFARRHVCFPQPERVAISPRAQIGRGTVIHPGVTIEGNTVIGENCVIGPNVKLVNTRVGDNVHLEFQCLYDTEINAEGA